MFSKILYPTDGSDNSKKALDYVVNLARQFQSEVVVLCCYHLSVYEMAGIAYGPYGENVPLYLNEEQEKYYLKLYEGILNEVETELRTKGIRAKTILERGDLSTTIINTIETEKCDLTVMASRGLGTIKSFLLGSVSNYVIHHSKCPVLLIH
jgi:nucleotide-binding universal stress UspA family protein